MPATLPIIPKLLILYMNSLSLYIHIPYCIHKCGYCDFNSHNINTDEMDDYVDALLLEIDHYIQSEKFADHSLKNRPIETIFFGGGTPTTLPSKSLNRILHYCRNKFNVSATCEITVEANPASIDTEILKELHSEGFNRMSVGVQSFLERDLRLLERVHSVDEIYLTMDRAREAGFDNLSLDLMFALPGQSLSDWEENLTKAIKINTEHISTYNLTIEPATAFFKLHSRGQLVMPSEEHQLEHYQLSIDMLSEASFNHYEISNFAKPGKESKHNITYWENREYLGLGAGASSYINSTRFKNWNLPSKYIREANAGSGAVESSEKLEPNMAMGETLMLGLRLLEKGVNIPQMERRFSVSFMEKYGNTIGSLTKEDLISVESDQIHLTKKGLFLADSVILEFIS
ncbi:MAG: radical SAM family heme chaperone HemW [Nitrospinales bacterium]